MQHTTRLAAALDDHRKAAGLAYEQLAHMTHASRGWLANIANGTRVPSHDRWVRLADDALNARGELVAAWAADHRDHEAEKRVNRTVNASLKCADQLLALPAEWDDDELHGQVAELATSYFWTLPEPALDSAVAYQSELVTRLRSGPLTRHARDLMLTGARISGILAYATLDLGRPAVAHRHTEVAWELASRSDHDELRAWIRGTQSLIARFREQYEEAERYCIDGMKHASHNNGTGRLRLLAGAAQCAANLGNAERAVELLGEMERERPLAASDPIEGILGFGPAKATYYGASSLMWIPDPKILRRAAKHAHDAEQMWGEAPRGQRSHKDAALTSVYGATAYIRLGELESAVEMLRPVLIMPAEHRISWLDKRMRDLARLLEAPRYDNSREARTVRAQLLGLEPAGGAA